jgi:hypothetical protein
MNATKMMKSSGKDITNIPVTGGKDKHPKEKEN